MSAVICSVDRELVSSLVSQVMPVGPVPDVGGAKRRSWSWAANVAMFA